jgi:hypothetical protein
MHNCRLLAIDIDGTLVNSREELSPATRDALVRAGRSGIHVVLATGRRYSRTLPLVEPLGVSVPVVTASGALIKNPADHRTLFRAEFDWRALRRLLHIVEHAGFDAVLYGDTFAEGFDYYCPRLDSREPLLAEFYERNPSCGRLWPGLMTDPPAGVFAGFVMGSQEQMLALLAELERALPEHVDAHVLRSPRYAGYMCEIAPAGVSKWSGIRHLAEAEGIADEDICAVGDDVNDIPMIRAAGLGVAMGNALESVKAAADRIAPGHDDDGLVQVVDWLLAESCDRRT